MALHSYAAIKSVHDIGSRTVCVAQREGWSLLMPEVQSWAKFIYIANWIEKTKIKKKRPGIVQFFYFLFRYLNFTELGEKY